MALPRAGLSACATAASIATFHNLPRLARPLIYPLFMAGGLRDCLGVRAATACAHGRTHAASVTLDDSCVASHGVLLAIAREASGSPVCTHGDHFHLLCNADLS